jgi:hypothetical protein
MKNILFFITILCLSTNVLAQKCDVGTDPFTKAKSVRFNYQNRTITYELKDSVITFGYTFIIGGELKMIVQANSSISFLLENGKTLEKKSIRDCVPASAISGNMVITSYPYEMQLTKEDIDLFAESRPVLVRLPDGQGKEIDVKFTGFNKVLSKKIYEGARCIKENL